MVPCIDVASNGSIKALDNPVAITFLSQNLDKRPVWNFMSCTGSIL